MARSPLIWFGGKGKYADHIINKMPAHKVYVEPFGGAAHVISQKPPIGHEVYNDIDGNVVNFLLVARSNPKEFQKACESLPYSRQLYEKWKKEHLPRDPFEKAVRWFYLNRSGISKGNADEVPQAGWRNSTKSNQNPARGYLGACSIIESFAKRMQGTMIEHLEPVYSLINMLGYMQKQEMSLCLIQVISAVKNSRSFVRNWKRLANARVRECMTFMMCSMHCSMF
ncbi:TPA: DNA adenine methylase [Bacillus mobilis]